MRVGVEGGLMAALLDCFFAMHQQETPARMRREVLLAAGWLAASQRPDPDPDAPRRQQ